jgi:hypothetical protein
MTEDVPAPPGGPDVRRDRAWDGTLWPDRGSRDVQNHTRCELGAGRCKTAQSGIRTATVDD